MAEETTSTWHLDLDVKEAIKHVGELAEKINSLGENESLKGLLSTVGELGIAMGIVGAAIFAMKEAMEIVFEAENIKAVNAQFELLTQNAGLAGNALKEGLVEASNGLIDDTELMKAANKAIVEMGHSAEKLPEIMELARKSTAVFGGDLVQNFEGMNQAIAAGNSRALRHMGIIIDEKKAMKEYADSIGATVDELSKAGRSQAIMNAALEKGKTAFEGVDPDVKAAQNNWQRFKVSIDELKESFILIFDKVLGPAITKILGGLSEFSKRTSEIVKESFGDGSEAAQAHLHLIEERLEATKKKIETLNQQKIKLGFTNEGELQSAIQGLKNLQIEQTKAHAALKIIQEEETKSGKKSVTDDTVNQEEKKKNAIALEHELLNLQLKEIDDHKRTATSVQQIDQLTAKQKILLEQQTANEVEKIIAKYPPQDQRANALIENQHKLLASKLEKVDEDVEKEREAALNRYLKHSTSVADGVARAFEVGNQKNKKNIGEFGKLGEKTFDSFGSHAQKAFEDMGSGAASAGDAVKNMMLGFIGDMASNYGQFLLLASIWPPNPVGLIAGGALLALGGFLKSQAGGGGGAPAASVASTNSSETGFGTRMDERPQVGADQGPSNLQTAPQKSVNLTVQGNLYNSEQTKLALMDIMRDATDATDFKYTQVGAGGP